VADSSGRTGTVNTELSDFILTPASPVLVTPPTVLREAILPPLDRAPALNMDETKKNEENKR
jgi:hypothetical protein